MSGLTLLLLQIGFLLLLWAFVFSIVYALRSDLFGQKVRRLPESGAMPSRAPTPVAATASAPVVGAAVGGPAVAGAAASAVSGVAAGTSAPQHEGPPANRLVITSGAKEGVELELGSEQLTIGRSADSGLVIRDDYTSTHHARLMLWGEKWMIQDLDSTNGTFLDGKRVSIPTPVPPGTPVSIGTTTFELRR